MLAITLAESILFDNESILIEYLNASVNIWHIKMEIKVTGFKANEHFKNSFECISYGTLGN